MWEDLPAGKQQYSCSQSVVLRRDLSDQILLIGSEELIFILFLLEQKTCWLCLLTGVELT